MCGLVSGLELGTRQDGQEGQKEEAGKQILEGAHKETLLSKPRKGHREGAGDSQGAASLTIKKGLD